MPELTGQNATLLFKDDTPNRTILDRILLGSVNLSRHTNFTNEQGSDFIDLIVLISRKMLSIWKHLEAYRAEEQRLREKFWANPDQPREHSQELYEEFDVFSVQVKSTLDHLVKVMRPVLGRKWTVYTFEKKGEGVLKALRGCVSANQKAPLQAMESQIFTDVNKKWLALIIEHRDRVNHGQMGGIKIERFSVYRAADGTVHLPIWNNEQTFIEAMDMVWRNLFLYIEDFIALSLNFRIKDQYSFVRREVPLPSPKPTWNVIPRRVADAMQAASAPSPAVLEKLNRGVREEFERRRRFGNVRPLITTTHEGHRVIAVGSRLYFHQEWRTFTDFLLFYVRDVMGRQWWETEEPKKDFERHPILQWYDRFVEASKTATHEEGGIVSAVPDGLMAALVLLAYDLYVLRDHGKLQDEVVQRLRHRDQFYGARYELFVAATFIRAGFDFAYEDEFDTTVKHAEFIAKHRESGLTIAVEAKARRRVVKVPFDVASIRPGVRELLVNAAEKKPVHPLVVFLELNLPPEPTDQPPSWMPHVDAVVKEIVQDAGGKWPFAAVLVTNRPHVYGQPDEPDPAKQFAVIRPHSSPIPMDVLDSLVRAVTQYGNVPSKFPGEFSDR